MRADFPDNYGKKGWPWDEESVIPQISDIDWPKITIVTPSFNQGRYIEETIRSVLLQNYPNLEYILIDGGSSDETVEIIKKYARWIDYWVSEKDEGQSHAINKGFKRATGEIISWLNSDDQLAKGSLFAIANAFLKNPQYSFIYGQCIEFDENHIHPFIHFPIDKLPLRYYYEFPYGQPSCFYKRECLEEVGYIDERFNYTMDYDLFMRIALKYKMLQIDDILSIFRYHNENKTVKLADIAVVEQITVIYNLFKSLKFKEGWSLFNELGLNPVFDKEYVLFGDYPFEHRHEILFEFLMPYVNKWYIVGDYQKVRKVFSFIRHWNPLLLTDKRIKRKLFILKFPDFLIKIFQGFK